MDRKVPAVVIIHALISGDGWSLSVPEVMRAVDADASLGPLLFCCQEYLPAQAQHTAACNAKCHLGRKLASCCCAQTMPAETRLRLTQEFMAQMLGVQRATVNDCRQASGS